MLFFGFFVHFLLAQKTNQKRAPEPSHRRARRSQMTNLVRPCACYTSLIGSTGQPKFSFAELPSVGSRHFRASLAPPVIKTVTGINTFWILNGLREFWEIATVLKIAARACCKQYCLSECNERVVLRGQTEKQELQNYLQP